MNQNKYRLKDLKIQNLTIENIQAIMLWSMRLVHPNYRKSPSFISFKTKTPLKLKIVVISNSSKKSKLFKNNFPIREKLKINDLLKSVLTKVELKSVNANYGELSTKNTLPFLVQNIEKIYCTDSKFVPTNSKIIALDVARFAAFEKDTPHFLVALDCEMVQTESGHEIGRVSLLDRNGNVLYDKFVKPVNQVTDYLTKYSGLTCDIVENGITFEQLQAELKNIVGRDTIILGHSLENDLVALNFYHEKLIDTSHVFSLRDGRKPKLKEIVEKMFDRKIQENEHSSVEDAKACLDLLKFKIREMQMYLSSKQLICGFRNFDHFIVNVCKKMVFKSSCCKLKNLFDFESNSYGIFHLSIFEVRDEDFEPFLENSKIGDDDFYVVFYCDFNGDSFVMF